MTTPAASDREAPPDTPQPHARRRDLRPLARLRPFVRAHLADLLLTHARNSLLLGLTALAISYLIAIPLGVLAAVKRNTWIDQLAMGGAILVSSTAGAGATFTVELPLENA